MNNTFDLVFYKIFVSYWDVYRRSFVSSLLVCDFMLALIIFMCDAWLKTTKPTSWNFVAEEVSFSMKKKIITSSIYYLITAQYLVVYTKKPQSVKPKWSHYPQRTKLQLLYDHYRIMADKNRAINDDKITCKKFVWWDINLKKMLSLFRSGSLRILMTIGVVRTWNDSLKLASYWMRHYKGPGISYVVNRFINIMTFSRWMREWS